MSQPDTPVLKHLNVQASIVANRYDGNLGAEPQLEISITRFAIKDVCEDVPGGACWQFLLGIQNASGKTTWRRASVSKKYQLNQPSAEFRYPIGMANVYYDERLYPDESEVMAMLKAKVLELVQFDLRMLKALEEKLKNN